MLQGASSFVCFVQRAVTAVVVQAQLLTVFLFVPEFLLQQQVQQLILNCCSCVTSLAITTTAVPLQRACTDVHNLPIFVLTQVFVGVFIVHVDAAASFLFYYSLICNKS